MLLSLGGASGGLWGPLRVGEASLRSCPFRDPAETDHCLCLVPLPGRGLIGPALVRELHVLPLHPRPPAPGTDLPINGAPRTKSYYKNSLVQGP